MKLLLNPATEHKIDSFLRSPSHGLLISGEKGLGVSTVSRVTAVRLAGSPDYVTNIEPEKTGITIEQVRELYSMTRSKAVMRRVILMHDVESMAQPAQNAFLKLLEEPPLNTFFILIAHNVEAVLPTIRSRVQSIELLPIGAEASKALLTGYPISDAVKGQLLFIADGHPAELIRLAEDAAYRESTFAKAADAKKLVGGAKLEKLLLAGRLSSDRTAALETLAIASRMCAFNLRRQATKQSLDMLKSLQAASDAISANGNIKAQLLRLCL